MCVYIFYMYIHISYIIYINIYIVYLGLYTTWLIRQYHGPMMGTSTFTSFPQRGSPSSLWSRMIRHNFKPKHAKAVCFTGDVLNRICRYAKSKVFPGTWRICRIYVDLRGVLFAFICKLPAPQTTCPRRALAPWCWRTEPARGLQLTLPNVAFWDKELASKSLVDASFGARAEALAPCCWRAEPASGLQLTVPNVRFWEKELASKSLPFWSEPYKPYAAEGRNRPAACSLRCLMFLSETRNWLPKACHLLVSGLPPQSLSPMLLKNGTGPRPAAYGA